MVCSKCGSSNVTMKSGVSKKNGREWKGFKCGDCDNMDFVKTQKTEKAVTPSGNGHNDTYKTMLFSYAKDITVALINAEDADAKKNPFKKACDGYKLLLQAYSKPYAGVGANAIFKDDTPEEFLVEE